MAETICKAQHWYICCAAIITLVLIAGPVCAGGVYKWKDAEGKTHYSDKAPPNVKAETISIKSSAQDKHTAERLNSFKKLADDSLAKRDEAKANALDKKREAQEIVAHCEKVRKQLVLLETSTRRQRVNEKGEREFIDEELRQKWLADGRAEVAKHCK